MKTLIKNLAEYKSVFLGIAITGVFISVIPFGTLWIVLVSIQTACLIIGALLSLYSAVIFKKKSHNFIYYKDFKGVKKCSRCGEEIHGGYTGRGTNTSGKKWRYYHNNCDSLNFCEEIRSSPTALSKYYQIYGMSPEDKIINRQ